MAHARHKVEVQVLPDVHGGKETRRLLRKFCDTMAEDRPLMIIDCSHVTYFDKSVIHLLLSCLEEAMKRNGDVKLSSLSPSATVLMKATGAHTLFEIYESSEAAIQSFDGPRVPALDSACLAAEFVGLPESPA